MEPLVSIIVPIYNVEQYIEECIKSIVNQTLTQIEIILVNDGTKDDSINKIKKYIDNDDRIILINKENGGLSSARNKGLEIAKGDYILFIDSDDYIDTDMVQEMYESMSSNDLDIVMCGYKRVENEKVYEVHPPIESNIIFNKEDIIKIVEQGHNTKSIWFVWRNMYRKDILTKNSLTFNEDIKFGEDSVFNMNSFLSSNKIMSIDKCLYNYRLNPNSLTQSKHKPNLEENVMLQYCEKIKIVKDYNLNKGTTKKINIYFIVHSLNILIDNIYKGNNRDAVEKLKDIRKHYIVNKALKDVNLIDILFSDYAKGIKLRSILFKYNMMKVLNQICK